MTSRNYSSTAVDTTLTDAITSSGTNLSVDATTGFPAAPFLLAIDVGAVAQELVLVTATSGTTLTVTRGYDSTSGVAHDAGAVVRHTHAAVDFRDSRTHEAATTAHGVAGDVVGTTDTQTLTNKDLSSGTNTFPSTLATKTGTETLTHKDLSDATNVYPATVKNPPGAMTAFAGPSAPDGWLLCDGSAKSRTTYAALFAAIGTTHGVGDGSTTFNLPDMRGRHALGAGTANPLGTKTGSATEASRTGTATSSSTGSHSHTITSEADHDHSIASLVYPTGVSYAAGSEAQESPSRAAFESHNHGGSTGDAGVHNHGGSTSSTGSHAHTVAPDYVALNWIIAH